MPDEPSYPSPLRKKNVLTQPIGGTGLVVILAVLCFLVLGSFHIVSDAPTVFVSRPYFGFSDMFASRKVCTSGPWIFAKAQHPSLCLALQEAGLIETDEEFESRVAAENEEARECRSRCNIRNDDYGACIAAC
jgi:hypothetical protein